MKRLRMITSTAVIAALLCAVLFVPLPHYVTCDFLLQTRDADTVYVDVTGTLVEIHAQPGQSVEAGQTLVVLQNEAPGEYV